MIDKDIEAIIFDFGGVLIRIAYEDTIKEFKKLGIKNFDEMYSKAQQSNLFDHLETGKITPEKFIDELAHYVPNGITTDEILEAWNAMIKEVPNGSIDILMDLKKRGIKLFLLSNTNSIHIEKAIREWEKVSSNSLQEVFDHVYFSHEVNLRKPNVEIFNHVCNDQNLDPTTTLFIDDSAQHIEGAKKIGLNTLHLESMDLLHGLIS